ncbi:hypothetical protein GGI12_005718 [Dipsacomyces acuminosporus]|nr:hypothetical protein GGI12_005718 [Dipsacomyces acuminosporus]
MDTNFLSNEQLAYVAARTFNKIWMPRCTREALQPFQTFCCELLRSTQIAVPIVMLTLFYVKKFKQRIPDVNGGAGSEYRMFVVALMLASKYLEDNTFTTQTWSDVSQLPAKDLIVMQREFLAALDHRLHVTETEYNAWITQLQTIVLSSDMDSPVGSKLHQHSAILFPQGLSSASSSSSSPSFPSIDMRSPVGTEYQVVPSPSVPQYHEIPQAELLPSPPAKRMRPSLPSTAGHRDYYIAQSSSRSSRSSHYQQPASAAFGLARAEFSFRLPASSQALQSSSLVYAPQQNVFSSSGRNNPAAVPVFTSSIFGAPAASCAAAIAARQHYPVAATSSSSTSSSAIYSHSSDRLLFRGVRHASDAEGVIGMPAAASASASAAHLHHNQHHQQQQQAVAAAFASHYQPLCYSVPSFGYTAGATAGFPIYSYGA